MQNLSHQKRREAFDKNYCFNTKNKLFFTSQICLITHMFLDFSVVRSLIQRKMLPLAIHAMRYY